MSANVGCTNCANAPALRSAWFEALVAGCEPDIVMVQGLGSRQEMEALGAVLPEHQVYFVALGSDAGSPEDERFEVVTWLRRAHFFVRQRPQPLFLTPDRTANTRFEGSNELRFGLHTWFADCRSELHYSFQNYLFDSNPIVREMSLPLLDEYAWTGLSEPGTVAGGFGIAQQDPAYDKLIAPPGVRDTPANTRDLANSVDLSGAPGIDPRSVTDHVLVTTERTSWQVPQWLFSTVEHEGTRITDHPPMCITVQEREGERLFFIPATSCQRNR